MSDKPLSYQPTAGLSYDPATPLYWDATALEGEIKRTFEICHGCRLCFKYCDSFPTLFSLLDGPLEGDVRRIDAPQTQAVMEACFQCKLCEVQCPYTVRDGHEYQLDFPRLVHRWQAQRARRRGIPLAKRILGNPDLAGRMARASLGLVNLVNAFAPARRVLEAILGVHHRKLLPHFAPRSFESWAIRAGLVRPEPGGEAVLFQTCYVQHNLPELGRDTIEVMQKNAVDVRCVRGLQCCGMPAWEHGDLDRLQKQARRNLALLAPFVERGAKVLVLNPTCSMMMRREYPELVGAQDRERARLVGAAVRDASEFLWSLREEERFRTDFISSPGDALVYHAPCHLRAQSIGFKGRDLLRKIPGLQPIPTVECCGHDGTWAMTTRGFEASQRHGKKALDAVREHAAPVCVTDCPLAALQFQQHTGKEALHPMTVLARAYRANGFQHPIASKPAGGKT